MNCCRPLLISQIVDVEPNDPAAVSLGFFGLAEVPDLFADPGGELGAESEVNHTIALTADRSEAALEVSRKPEVGRAVERLARVPCRLHSLDGEDPDRKPGLTSADRVPTGAPFAVRQSQAFPVRGVGQIQDAPTGSFRDRADSPTERLGERSPLSRPRDEPLNTEVSGRRVGETDSYTYDYMFVSPTLQPQASMGFRDPGRARLRPSRHKHRLARRLALPVTCKGV